MSRTTSNAVLDVICFAGIATASVSLWFYLLGPPPAFQEFVNPEPEILELAPENPELEIAPTRMIRNPTPMMHFDIDQADGYAAADMLVDGDIIVDGPRFYKVRIYELQDGRSWFVYERCHGFEY